MADTSDILVVGAGVLGLCVAVELARRGQGVTLIDPGGRNASSVAAGMIAPALEAARDGVDAERARLFREAAELWPAFATELGIEIKAGPSVWRGGDPHAMTGRLLALGFAASIVGDSVETTDFQVEPGPAMARMHAQARVTNLRATACAARAGEGRWTLETDMGVLNASTLVLATGAAVPLDGLPPTLAAGIASIVPIRGQIGWTPQRLCDRVTRGTDGYVAPMGRGAVVGASMGAGRRDIGPDWGEATDLLAAAAALAQMDVTAEAIAWRVGIRGATADGLPMAGASGIAGLHLALAPRRNGWLLGPMVGQVVADGIEGRAPGNHAVALDPQRFFCRA